MHRLFACTIVVLILCIGLAAVTTAQETPDDQTILRNTLANIDGSIASIRSGDVGRAQASLDRAKSQYQVFHQRIVENYPDLASLDNKVLSKFDSTRQSLENEQLSKGEKEKQLRGLRSDLDVVAGKLGIQLPLHLQHAMFVIMAASVFLALIVILLIRASIDLPSMRQLKSELSTLGKEMREAYSKKNIKLLHKIQPRYQQLTSRMMGFTLRQMVVTLPPYFLLWWLLGRVYSGWVVVWLPWSGVKFPLLGFWTSCGFLSWLIITYFGFSMILRRLFLAGV